MTRLGLGGNLGIKRSLRFSSLLVFVVSISIGQKSVASECKAGLVNLFSKTKSKPLFQNNFQIQNFSSLGHLALQFATKMTSNSFQFFFYPIAGPAKLLHDLRKLKGSQKKLPQFSNEILYHHAPMALGFSAVAMRFQNDYTSAFEILTSIPELNSTPPRGPVVIVDSFEDQDDLMRWGPALLALWYAKNYPQVSVHFLQSRNPSDLFVRLEQIQKNFGLIDRMEFASHGSPGVLHWGKLILDSESFTGVAPFEGFKSGATLRFFNCSLAQDGAGEALAKGLGRVFLPRGGKIVFAARPVIAFWGDFLVGLMSADPNQGLDPMIARVGKLAQTPLLAFVDFLAGYDALSASRSSSSTEGLVDERNFGFKIFEIPPQG